MLRDGAHKTNGTVIGKRAWKQVAGFHSMNPHIRETEQINAREEGPIGPHPRKSRGPGVQIPPDINHPTVIKQSTQSNATFPRQVPNIGTWPVQLTVKDNVKITPNNSRNRRINF